MSRDLSKHFRSTLLLLAMLCAFAACWKKSGDAIVIAKDYLPAIQLPASPSESPKSETTPAVESEETVDDTNVSTVDPRATDHEQWIASVRMTGNGRLIEVRMNQSPWEKLKVGDRVHVKYREGKYTGTIWSAEID